MKHLVRAGFLMVVLVGTFVASAVPQVSALDGGPLPLCPPTLAGKCQGPRIPAMQK
jgi:hypothetical protein